MSQVRVLVGTRKGGFVINSDAKRQRWSVSGPFFTGWEMLTELKVKGTVMSSSSWDEMFIEYYKIFNSIILISIAIHIALLSECV